MSVNGETGDLAAVESMLRAGRGGDLADLLHQLLHHRSDHVARNSETDTHIAAGGPEDGGVDADDGA